MLLWYDLVALEFLELQNCNILMPPLMNIVSIYSDECVSMKHVCRKVEMID